jgi:hypothetical protein
MRSELCRPVEAQAIKGAVTTVTGSDYCRCVFRVIRVVTVAREDPRSVLRTDALMRD